MAKLSKEQEDQLAELERLRDAPDEPEQDDDGGDDGHVIVLRGSRADSFLAQLLGPAPKRGNSASEPASTKSKKPAPKSAADQAAQDDDDQGDDDQGEQDAPPPRTNRYFR